MDKLYKKWWQTGWAALAIVTSVSVITSATVAQAQSPAQDTIRIGISSTGSFALASQSGVRGVEVWVDEVNRRGGIDMGGTLKRVELVKLDDRSDKQMVTRVYERLIVDEKVDLVFAPFGSTLTSAAATVTDRLKTYMMIWSAAADSLYDQGFKYIVSGSQMPVSAMLRASMELAAQLGVKKVALLYSDEPFPAGLADSGREQARIQGIDVVLYERYPKGQKDFSTLLQKVRASGAQAFIPTSYEGDLISMVRQMRQLNIHFPYVFMVYASTPQFLNIGKDADYIFSHTNYHPAVNWPVTAGMTRAQFAQAYSRLFPNAEFEPDFQTALAYGAAVLTEEIIRRAGTTEAQALKDASLALSDQVTVMAGPYAIAPSGKQLKMPFPVVQNLPDKGLVTVWPKDVATETAVYPIPTWRQR